MNAATSSRCVGVNKTSAEEWATSSNDALEFKLIREARDLDDDSTTFKPDMSHQVFGCQETIFGYKGLKIRLYYTAAKLTTYFGISYKEKIPRKLVGVEADEISQKIVDKLEPGFYTNLDDFVQSLPKDESFVPYGDLLHSVTLEDEEQGTRTFEIYTCNVTTPGFRSYHARLQTFILWYIDGASFIDDDDENWIFFVLYEKYKSNGRSMYSVAGYATVYMYYAYPCNTRPRISQMLVLPPFQRRGLGAQLLDAIYRHFFTQSEVIDITVEDPSEEFQHLRDYVDAKNCSKLESFQREKLRKGFSDEMVAEAKSKLKIHKKQARRVYEILRLKYTDLEDADEYRQYRLDVKNRLNVPYKKEQFDLEKLQRALPLEEIQFSMRLMEGDQRMQNLERDYRGLEKDYQHVLSRLQHCI